ncbi:AbrB/MazE/SpoVT family DNA-binding domain-containing protein [Pseudomonas sp. WS 5011]|uniref:AbrB/MazE/SpoVT family DNA-binding domain-containing protein n=1 Tax=Pseudomonas sp. WS 5011 TaxID=2717477 RepID=UPI001472E203|nr:AbrB/MazE/SpoVT family DNA-binding domain-containing protein [Pseudomonas sp. WS 5011]NMY52973.1 AbrB/MazE/SpoVT family DNA-binding domain-containing protein [Pseudomonas sp. WS 5011]
MTRTVKVEQHEDGSLIVPLPNDLLAQLGVGIGDVLYLAEEYVGTTRCLMPTKTPQIPDPFEVLVEHRNNEAAGT